MEMCFEPKDGLMAIGSGGNYALAAARALYDSKLSAEQIAKKVLKLPLIFVSTQMIVLF